MRSASTVFELVKLEMKLEWRTKYALAGSLLYVLTTVFVLYSSLQKEEVIPWNALYWMIALFIAINAITKSFSLNQSGTHLYLYQLASPIEIIFAKSIYNFLLVFALFFVSFAFFTLFMDNPIQHLGVFLVSLVLGSFGISFILTFISSISSKTDNSAVFMAILGFPLIIPIFLSLIKLTETTIKEQLGDYMNDIYVLLALDALIFGIAIILFPFLWRD